MPQREIKTVGFDLSAFYTTPQENDTQEKHHRCQYTNANNIEIAYTLSEILGHIKEWENESKIQQP